MFAKIIATIIVVVVVGYAYVVGEIRERIESYRRTSKD